MLSRFLFITEKAGVENLFEEGIGKDKIYLNFTTIDKDKIKISKTTFYDGLNELVDKKFLAPVADATHWFWLNPDYLWNGDRLTFVQT